VKRKEDPWRVKIAKAKQWDTAGRSRTSTSRFRSLPLEVRLHELRNLYSTEATIRRCRLKNSSMRYAMHLLKRARKTASYRRKWMSAAKHSRT